VRLSQVVADIARFPFGVIEGPGGKPLIQVEVKGETRTFPPEAISAMVLGKMKDTVSHQCAKCPPRETASLSSTPYT
jgi:molecular chaperone DnaK (HSP70)